MRAGRMIAGFLAAMTIAGCTDVVPMVPANPQAQAAGGDPQLYYSNGLPFGVAKIVMPNGEVLPGEFRIDETGGDNFHAFGNGPRTQLRCAGSMVAGHGHAECRSQDGAVYRLTL